MPPKTSNNNLALNPEQQQRDRDEDLLNALPHMSHPTDGERMAQQLAEKRVNELLTSLDPSEDSGEIKGTVEVTLVRSGRTSTFDLPIKSIPEDVLTYLTEDQETPQVPFKMDPTTREIEDDITNPNYLPAVRKLRHLQAVLRPRKVLYGLDIDLKIGGRVVWSQDDSQRGEVYEEEALKALRALKLTPDQLQRIETAIDQLSLQARQEDDADLEKNS